MKDDLKNKNKMEDTLKKNKNGRRPQKKWKWTNLIGCDTIVNLPSLALFLLLTEHLYK
jgi:hypothetical protein